MRFPSLSRRQFAQLAGTAAAVRLPLRGADPLTAKQIVERIQSALGGEWPATGPDGFKAGDPATTVKGIATTAMATMSVLKEASQAGANLILTYEPTFFGRQESPPATDPVYSAKRAFIEKNNLGVFRLRDHWQARKENEMTTALADALHWGENRVRPGDIIYEIPPSTAEEVVAHIRQKLELRGGLRAVGDRKATVRRVLLYPGTMTPSIMWQRYSEVDLVIAGEVREWENTHYAADWYTAGAKRGLVTIGRVVSEEAGMGACAEWLKTVVKEVPARWVPAGDLYWRAV